MNKKETRLRRAKKTRAGIAKKALARLVVYRTPRHIYAQIIASDGGAVVVSASTLEKALRSQCKGNIESATKIGKLIAERALEKGVKQIAFDRSGFRYHGRVKALADAAREGGLNF
ncbi:MAG: 50S ribosomal protein L18 [Gammaproteobacteria bacterium]|nr:50S ribosomal protein L18 [Gammaproteobacteria bacterium]